MKRIWILLMAWACMVNTALAEDNIYVDAVNLPLTGEGNLVVKFSFTAENYCSGFQFEIILPEGVEFVTKTTSTGLVGVFTPGDCYEEASQITTNVVDNNRTLKAACNTTNSAPIIGKTGVLASFKIKASEGLTVGASLTGDIKEVKYSSPGGTSFGLSNSQFNITVVDWIELDENSTIVPSSVLDPVKVKVFRTLKADNWSTICLPFNMTKSQVEDIFGDDVQLAEYIDHDIDVSKTPIVITMNFEKANLDEDGFTANYPYIIKTKSKITTFTVDNVEIDSDEENAITECTNGKTGARKVVYSSFKGTYHAGTIVPEDCLFLSNNKLYFSTGLTEMKAFRGYFQINNLPASSNTRLLLSYSDGDGNTTKIDARTMESIETGKVYNMAGQYVGEAENTNSLPKGVYIVNGKKKVIK